MIRREYSMRYVVILFTLLVGPTASATTPEDSTAAVYRAEGFYERGDYYESVGDFQNAVIQYQVVFKIYIALYGNDSANVLVPMQLLARAYSEMGDVANTLIYCDRIIYILRLRMSDSQDLIDHYTALKAQTRGW